MAYWLVACLDVRVHACVHVHIGISVSSSVCPCSCVRICVCACVLLDSSLLCIFLPMAHGTCILVTSYILRSPGLSSLLCGQNTSQPKVPAASFLQAIVSSWCGDIHSSTSRSSKAKYFAVCDWCQETFHDITVGFSIGTKRWLHPPEHFTSNSESSSRRASAPVICFTSCKATRPRRAVSISSAFSPRRISNHVHVRWQQG